MDFGAFVAGMLAGYGLGAAVILALEWAERSRPAAPTRLAPPNRFSDIASDDSVFRPRIDVEN